MALYRCGGGEQTTDITPSNSSPAAMTSGTAYKAQGDGYAVESILTRTPGDNFDTLNTSNVYKFTDGAIYIKTTATQRVNPNDGPVSLTQDTICRIVNSDGYAIKSYQNPGAPQDYGTPFNSGFVRFTTSGYAYRTRPTSATFSEKYSNLTASTSISITDLADGNSYLVLVYFVSSTNMLVNRYDGCTASSGTLTKISNLTSAAAHAVGTFYSLNASGTSVTITAPNNAYCKVFR